jgi:hypothetical protein
LAFPSSEKFIVAWFLLNSDAPRPIGTVGIEGDDGLGVVDVFFLQFLFR